jgi:hypothetical protein
MNLTQSVEDIMMTIKNNSNERHGAEPLRGYCSLSQEVFCILCNSEVHYHVHKSPPLAPNLNKV